MRNKKFMAAIPMVATLIAPMTAFAATSYITTTANVENVKNAITADAPTNEVSVSVTQGSTFSVTIPKAIVLAGAANADNKATYKVTVSGNIASNETINVVPTGDDNGLTFAMSDDKGVKKDLTATIAQTITKFVDKQVTTNASDTANLVEQESGADSKTVEGTITIAGLTSGSWSGNFNFAISLSAAS